MTVPKSFTFYSNTINLLTWTITDTSGQIVNNATVTATLFWGRDKINPNQTPGVAVPNFTDIDLTFSSQNQNYSATIQALSSIPLGGDYILVVDAISNLSSQIAHWERPSVITDVGP